VEAVEGEAREGVAEGVDEAGRLVVRFEGAGTPEALSAADVVHLRPAAGTRW
jgi:hypothetical protein